MHFQVIKAALLAIVLGLLHTSAPKLQTVPENMQVISEEVASEVATVVMAYPEAKRERYARVLFVFGYFEGGWQASPKGWNDGGRACGVMQVHAKLAIGLKVIPPWMSCAALRADRVLGFQAGLLVFIHFETLCKGDLRCALNGYATGRVDWSPSFVLPLVRERCDLGEMDC